MANSPQGFHLNKCPRRARTLTDMSRGPGRLQQHILDAVVATPGVHPVIALAQAGGYDVRKASVRQSFNRAARALHDSGQVRVWTITVPTARLVDELNDTSTPTNHREILCVSHPDADPTDSDWSKCHNRALTVFFPQTAIDVFVAHTH